MCIRDSSDVFMRDNAVAQKPLVDAWTRAPPPRDGNELRDVVPPGIRSSARKDHQTAVVKDLQNSENNGSDKHAATLDSLLHSDCEEKSVVHLQCEAEKLCKKVDVPDSHQGPGHVAWKLIEEYAKFNDEQIDVVALMVWPIEKAWRTREDASTHVLPVNLGLSLIHISEPTRLV